MSQAHLPTLLQLRLLVGFLGERAQCNWWPTAFYEASSRLFLEPVFSKTSRLAQYHAVVEAARRLHDEHLNVGSYHLFRLPEELEQDLHSLTLGSDGEKIARQSPLTKDAALNDLGKLGTKTHPFSPGPTAVGNIRDIASSKALQSIAGAYAWAFNQNAKSYPYLLS
jgi:hypothetical protein